MACITHKDTAGVFARWLDPLGQYGPRDEALRQAAVDSCADCRSDWQRLVLAHRLMVHGDVETPTGFESRRRLAAFMPGPEPAKARRKGWILGILGATAVAATAIALLLPGAPAPAPDDIRARGVERPTGFVGIGLTGVAEDGVEYEVVHDRGLFLGDFLRLSYSNERAPGDPGSTAPYRYLFVFGLQTASVGGAQTRIWYTPSDAAPAGDQAVSLGIREGRLVALDFETRLAAHHALGPLRVIALFTPEPLTIAAVSAMLSDGMATMNPTDLTAALRPQLPERVHVQVIDTQVLPGRRQDEAPHGR